MRPQKGDVITDRIWPEFGKGLVTRSSKKSIGVLFDNGFKKYPPCDFDILIVVHTKEQREGDITAAYERFKNDTTESKGDKS